MSQRLGRAESGRIAELCSLLLRKTGHQVLSSLPDVFDFARFSYISVIARTAVSTRSSTGVLGAPMR
jgi:hypothetical protein